MADPSTSQSGAALPPDTQQHEEVAPSVTAAGLSGTTATATATATSSPAESSTHHHQRRRPHHERGVTTDHQVDDGQVEHGVPGLERIGLDENQEKRHSGHGNASAPAEAPQESTTAFPSFPGDKPWSQRSWLYQFMPFRGMWYDLRRRAPYYMSDWTETFLPRNWWTTAQAVVRIYFINLMPAIAYVLDMYHRTHGVYGINEVILASALAAIVFPIFSVQPLTFVGVTGLINLVNYTQYDIVVEYYGLDQMDYLRVQAWSLIWAAGFHFLAAIFNISDFTRFITDMTSTTFGFYVGIVYIQKGIELLLLEYEPAPLDNATGWLSVTTAILFCVSVYLVSAIGKTSYLPYHLRTNIATFAFAAGCIFWTGFTHFPKYSLERVPIERLPITRAFFPTMDRSWFVDFWNIEARWAFVGAPLGFLITLLFWFDHNVSSVMAQARQFPVKRPAGFHWDFFLLGITTLVSGFLGLPAPNGLVPQCPWHTEALSVFKQVKVDRDDEETTTSSQPAKVRKQPSLPAREHIVNTRVVEQRGSHLLIGALTLATMTRPFLVALGTMPRAVFAGIFLLVGWGSIEGNIITSRTLAVFRDRALAPADDPLNQVRRTKIALFVAIQWFFFAITFAISQTIAGIGFPVLITLLIPFRYYVVPKWFSPLELRILDAPTADADVVLASIGHESERCTGQGVRVAADTKIAGTEYDVDENKRYDDRDDDEDSTELSTDKNRHGKATTDTARPYVIDGDEFELQSASASAQSPYLASHASAVQASPFVNQHDERPTSVNMREHGIAFLNVPEEEAAADGSVKKKKNRQSLISRLLHRSQGDSDESTSKPNGKQRQISEATVAEHPATEQGPEASELPAIPTTKPTESALGLSFVEPGSSAQSDAAAVPGPAVTAAPLAGTDAKDDEAPVSPLDEAKAPLAASQPETNAGQSTTFATAPTTSAAIGAVGTSSAVTPDLHASKASDDHAAALDAPTVKPAPSIEQPKPETLASSAQPSSATTAATNAPAVPAKEVPAEAPTAAEPGTDSAPSQAKASTDGSNNVKTTAEIAAAAGVGGGTAATAIAAAHGRGHPDAADQHEAARQAAAETLARAEEQKRQLEQQKKDKTTNKKLIKEQEALEKKRIAEAKKTMKEEEKKRKQAVKDRAVQEKEAHRLALLQADREKRRLDDDAKALKERKSQEAAALKQQEKDKAAEAKRQKEADAEAAKKARADEKARKSLEAAEAKRAKEEEKQRQVEREEAERKEKAEAEEKVKHEKEAAAAAAAAATAAAVAEAEREKKQREQQEAEEQRRKQAEEESARKKQAEADEQARKVREEEEAKRAQEAEQAAKEQEERQATEAAENARKEKAEQAAKDAAALAAAQKARDEEDARKSAEAEAARKADEEEQAKKAAAAEAARKAREEEEAKKIADAEAAKRAKEEAKQKKAADKEAAKKAKAEEKARKSQDAEDAKRAKQAQKAKKAEEAEHAKKAKKEAEEKAKHEKEAAAAAAAATAAAAAAEIEREQKAKKEKARQEEENRKRQQEAQEKAAQAEQERQVQDSKHQDGSTKAGNSSAPAKDASTTGHPAAEAAATGGVAAAVLPATASHSKKEDDSRQVPASGIEAAALPSAAAQQTTEAPASSQHPDLDRAVAQSEAARADLEASAEPAKADDLVDQKKARREAQIPPKGPESVSSDDDEHDAELAGLAATAAAVAGATHAGDKSTPPTPPKDAQASATPEKDVVAQPATAAEKSAKDDSGAKPGLLKRLFSTKRSGKPVHDENAAPPLPTANGSSKSAEDKNAELKNTISPPVAATRQEHSTSDLSDEAGENSTGKSLLTASGLGLGAAGVARGKSKSKKAAKPTEESAEDAATQPAEVKDLPSPPTPAKGKGKVTDADASAVEAKQTGSWPAVAAASAPETPKRALSKKKSKKDSKSAEQAPASEKRSSKFGGVFSSALPGAPARSNSRGKGVGGSKLVEELPEAHAPKEDVRIVREGDQVFEEHINPRFAKHTGGSKVSAVQWRH